MIEKVHRNLKPGIYLFIQESGSGKSERLNELLTSIHGEEYILISHKDIIDKYKFEDLSKITMNLINERPKITKIFIDGIFDKYTNLEFTRQLELLNDFQDKQIFIISNNNELLNAYSSFARNIHLDQEEENILTDKIQLGWKNLYISNYWKILNIGNGKMKIGGKKFQLDEADFTALLLASRYWGLANFIFKIDVNTNEYYFKALSRSFFHDQELNLKVNDFLEAIQIPQYLNIAKIKSYISVNGNLKYDKQNMLNLLNDLQNLKMLNFDLFIYSLIGRQILQKKGHFVPQSTLRHWRSTISNLAHSTDYVLNGLISKNRKQSLQIINLIMKLDLENK